jgi:hypothetical protein
LLSTSPCASPVCWTASKSRSVSSFDAFFGQATQRPSAGARVPFSACVALVQTIDRLIDPKPLEHLGALAAAGAIGFIGNELAALIRLRAGRRLDSPALVAARREPDDDVRAGLRAQLVRELPHAG